MCVRPTQTIHQNPQGELMDPLNPKNNMTTLEEQLKNKANFMEGDQLYLVRCMACPDAGKSGKENYPYAVAYGTCAWCGWSNEFDDTKTTGNFTS